MALDPIPTYYFPYEAPIPAHSLPSLVVSLMVTGLLFMSWFFTLQTSHQNATSGSKIGRFLKEVIVSLIGSLLLGSGTLFLCLIVGIYV